MYLHLYNEQMCNKSKNILFDPLKSKIYLSNNNFLNLIKKLFLQRYKLTNLIYQSFVMEQEFIKNNFKKIKLDLMQTDFNYLYQKYSSPLTLYLLDHIVDYFEIDKFGINKESIYIEKLISFFYMNELLFYISMNNVNIYKKNKIVHIVPKNREYKYLKRRWFAYEWEEESKKSNIGLNVLCNITIPKNKLIEATIKFSELYMDKIFFLNSEYIAEKNKRKEHYIFIHNLCKFFSILQLAKDNKISINDPLLNDLQLNKNNFLKDLINLQKNQNSLDKGFAIENNLFKLDLYLDIYNILKSYLLAKYENKLSKISAQFGEVFEDYLKNYSQKNFTNDYEVIIDNIDYNNKNINVDIDFTLFDKNRKYYYFVQVKYAISNKPYLKNEFKSICNNKTLKKGIQQLQGFVSALKDIQFKKLLLNKKIDIKNDNYSLILIHTISQFDFHELNGIQLYEWNTFRNLLGKGKQQQLNINLYNPSEKIIKNKETLPLENVDKVIEISINNSNIDFNKRWNNFLNTFFRFELNNISFASNIK